MKFFAATAALALTTLLGTALPASAARDGFVIDNAHLFSSSAISAVNTKISNLKAQTGKEIVVDTESSLDGQTAQAAAEKVFSQQQVNGVLIFVAKPKIGVIPDTASGRWFTPSTTASIQSAIRGYFKSGDFDGGLNAGVDSTLSIYQQHLGSVRRNNAEPVTTHQNVGGGFHMSWIVILIVLFVAFLIIRSIFRAMMGPRNFGGGPGYGPGPGGPGYGGPGYGGGYGPGYGGGMGGGGGGFFSGLLGGLGGAFIGNELFGGRRDDVGGGINGGFGGNDANMGGGNAGQDASGWQSDAGQADMGNASFGDFGGSGGGGDSGGGWGGGGDSGGGGGDSGGGW
jgi:uncharacterized protein